jgi:hypothetical protein
MKKILSNSRVLICLFSFGINVAHAAQYKELEGNVEHGGILSGQVVFDGVPPPKKMLKVDTDADTCGSEQPSEELLVDKSGGVQNVVLNIEGIESGKKWSFPQEFVYDQKNCAFVPHVMLIKPKTKGAVLNSDNVSHNVHTVSRGIYNVNRSVRANTSLAVKKKIFENRASSRSSVICTIG